MKYSVKDGWVFATGKWPTTELEALKESVKKWEFIAALPIKNGQGPCAPGDSCALCKMYVRGQSRSCNGCPVMLATGRPDCAGTPYPEYTKRHDKAAARAEVKFLKSLLPKRKGRR